MALKDKLREINGLIDAKQTEADGHKTKLIEAKKVLEDSPIEVLTNPESDEFKAADAAYKPVSKASDELAVLQGQFQRLSMMEADGGEGHKGIHRENDLDRDPWGGRKHVLESIGAKAIGSEAYKALKERGAFNDGSQQSVGNQAISDAMPREDWIKSLRGMKSLLTGQDPSGQAILGAPERIPGIDILPQLPLGIFDLITLGQTDAPSIEFVRMVNRTINAREVREASTSADIGSGVDPNIVTATQGGLKPESGFTFEKVTRGVKTIAHMIPATRSELDDAPGLQTTIDSEMRTGVDRKAETQVIQGNGQGDDIEGILATAGISNYLQGTAAPGEPAVDAIHRLFTVLRLLRFEPSALASHPLDWQEIRLSKDNNGQYQYGPPSQAGATQVWGIPVSQTIAVPEGSPIAAEWPRAEFRVREAVQVLVSDSHRDWFARNLLALLAEARGVLVIRRPQAFGTVELL